MRGPRLSTSSLHLHVEVRVHENSQHCLTRAVIRFVMGSISHDLFPPECLFLDNGTPGLDFSMHIWGETPKNLIQTIVGMCMCIFLV